MLQRQPGFDNSGYAWPDRSESEARKYLGVYLWGSIRSLAAELEGQLSLEVVGALDGHQQLLHQARQLSRLHTQACN